MQILPMTSLNQSVTTLLGLLFDTDLPNPLDRSVHGAFNDAVTFRSLTRAINTTPPVAPIQQKYEPQLLAHMPMNNFYPAWVPFKQPSGLGTRYDTLNRIVPKVRLPALDQRTRTLNALNVTAYNETVAQTILSHRLGLTSPQYVITSGNLFCPNYSKTDEGWYLFAEYDFGADVTISDLVVVSTGSTSQTQMVFFNNQQQFVQALVNNVWVDVVDAFARLRTITNYTPVGTTLDQPVTATKFRIVSKQAAVPTTSGFYPFSLMFFGNYVGQAPRVIGKIKSMVMTTIIATTQVAGSVWSFTSPAVANAASGRYWTQIGLRITDDIKLQSANDLLVGDANYSRNLGEFPIPAFRLRAYPMKGRGV